MKRMVIPGLCLVTAVALLCLCGKREAKKAALVIGGDTLHIEQVRTLVPEALPDSEKMRLVTCRYMLRRTLSAELRAGDSAIAKLFPKLSLVSGLEYTAGAAGLLLDAASALDGVIKNSDSVAQAMTSIESLAALAEAGKSPCCASPAADRVRIGELAIRDKRTLAAFCSAYLGISREMAETVVSFIPAARDREMENISAMVQGLIADTANRPRKKVREPAPATADNSVEALRYRTQQSIRDSIGRHIPNLQQMYKRSLKTNTQISGVVWVTFRVNADGGVIWANIKTSQIDNRQFLLRLLEYARTIQFKPIPKTAGNMTFEFPFEFASDE
jgi:TonB family protein